jgi:pyruvate/2-oxoacid:ferredoxin oxidoreductase beta subunit/Pyruvate/2-oxoacid:ferredoxin oxidoreductase gamma subunit
MEVTNKILTKAKMPFCPGCGHGANTRSITKAFENLGFGTKDVTMVSDIGCTGLVDPLFASHTIHGLHGRSPALGVGVALGLNRSDKKVVVLQGDGGATIGLQHILEAARRNIDMTLVVYNNLLFGMTGGQMSGLSTNDFKEFKQSADDADPYDIVNLAHQAGAAYAVRVNDLKKYTEVLEEAIATPGFSLVELASLCTSYGMKKVAEFKEFIVAEEKLTNKRPVGYTPDRDTKPLLDGLKGLDVQFKANIEDRIGVVIAGSAGGGVQSAAVMLAQAGILAGLHTTMKGEYPITVGTGFSVAEVILSKEPINYTGLEKPNAMLIVTEDGWNKVKDRVADNSKVYLDNKIGVETHPTKAFFKMAGKKGAALSAVSYWIKETGIFPIEALEKVVENHKYATSLQEAIASADKL